MAQKQAKTIREFILREYAKLIAEAIEGKPEGRKKWPLVTYTFEKLKREEMKPSAILRENMMLVRNENVCAYCEVETEGLENEHIIPRAKGGIDHIDNMVLACRACNSSKSDKDLFEWYGTERQYEIPRLVLGKYLKLMYDRHEQAGTLDAEDLNGDGKLDIFDLGAI